MKFCSYCGRPAVDYANFCPQCGRPHAIAVMKTAPAKKPLSRIDRMAIAGFVLSLLGIFSVIGTPLQIVSLLLSVCSCKTTRCKVFAVLGIILSCIALFLSCCFWIVFFSDPQYFLDQLLYPTYY